MSNEIKNNRISFTSLCIAIYFAITPVYQTLLLSNGSTVNKYLSIFIVVLILIKQSLEYGRISIQTQITGEATRIIAYVVISIVWALSTQLAINATISIIEYIVFALLVCSVTWNNKEKKLFLFAIVVACAIYSFTIAGEVSDGRSVLSGINERETDPNMLAANLAIGMMICLRFYLVSKKVIVRWASFICMIMILYGIIATGSRTGLLTSAVGIIYVLRKNDVSVKRLARILLVITIIIVGATVVLSGKTSLSEAVIDRFVNQELVEGGNGRTDIWERYFRMMFEQVYSLFIGNGYGNASFSHSVFYNTAWRPETHNDFVELLSQGGIILVLLVFLLAKKVWKISKEQRNVIGSAALLMVLVSGLTLNCFNKYNWWNCIILAYIGVDCLEDTEEVT